MAATHTLKAPTKTRKGWRIRATTNCWVLEEGAYTKKTKELAWVPVGYYANIEELLPAYFETHARASDRPLVEAIRDARLAIQEAKREIAGLKLV